MSLHLYKSKGYALLLALLPVIMMYRVPGIGMGVSTVLIAVSMLYAGVVLLVNFGKIDWRVILPIVVYFVYVLTKSDVQNMLLCVAIIVHLMAISTGAVDSAFSRKVIETVSMIAAIGIILQVFMYYVGGVHIRMINPNMILDSMDVYENAIRTGYSQLDRMYRPSAFFLEPSHFSTYCVIGLGSLLFKKKVDYKKALLVTVGILLTTSGMGFVLVFAMWAWWFLTRNERVRLSNRIIKFVPLIVLLLVAVFVLAQTSYFGSIIRRFLGTSEGGYNAIWGRTLWWEQYFGELSTNDLVFGQGIGALPEVYFTGFMTQLYAYGSIGVGLLAWFLVNMLFKSRQLPRTHIIMYMGLFFVSNLTGFIPMIFHFGTIIAVYVELKDAGENRNLKTNGGERDMGEI